MGTLLFLQIEGRVLLIEKKTGHGAGRINAPGGKLNEDESVVACAIRETQEEVGVTPLEPRCFCEMRFVELDGPQWLGFAFAALACEGTIVETREAKPFWCPTRAIPYSRMWPDDAIWLPRGLRRIETDRRTAPLVYNFLFRDEVLLEYSVENTAS